MILETSVPSSLGLIDYSRASSFGVVCDKPYELVLDEGESVKLKNIFLLKDNEEDRKPVLVRMTMDNEDFLIANIDAEKCPSITVDILIQKSCILSHSCINGTVLFYGCKVDVERPWSLNVDDDVYEDDDDACGEESDDDDDECVELDAECEYDYEKSDDDDDACVELERSRLKANEDDSEVPMEVTGQVFFDIEIAGESAGRIVFGLFGKAVPKTAEKFRALCTGEKRIGKSGKYYKGSTFHKANRRYLIMGGDLTKGRNKKARKANLKPENLKIKPDKPGLLVMTNNGACYGTEFFITLASMEWLSRDSDCRAVVIGKVMTGMEVVYKITAQTTSRGVIKSISTIADCGECD